MNRFNPLYLTGDKKLERNSVPLDVYFSQVDALHADAASLLVGNIGSFLVLVYICIQAQDLSIFAITATVPVVLVFRMYWLYRFARERTTIRTRFQMRRWELIYSIGSTLHVACFGLGMIVVFHATDDPFCRLAWSIATIMYMTGIAGRNFATGSLVLVQLVAGFAPIGVALLMAGGDYALLSIAVVPAILGSYSMAKRLRKLLLGAVLTSRENAQNAARFDAALNNMPYGLWMFGENGELIVGNEAGPRLLQTAAGSSQATVQDVFAAILRTGRVAKADVDRVLDAYEARRRGSVAESIPVETKDGKFFCFNIHALADQGTMILLEDMTARRKAESVIHDLARFDPLTRLLNRAFFEATVRESLDRIAWRNESFSLLFIDLDHFKSVNDTLGHQRGDTLLRAVAERLRSVVRETDLVARFGGDEFVIQQTRVTDPAQTQKLAQRIVTVLGAPFDIEGHIVTVGASVGMALAPRDGADVETLMKNADMALYRAKGAGRGCWQFFEREMDLELNARRILEDDIRSALSNESFEVHYQPIYLARTRRIVGAEALMRLTHPERGPIPPFKFVAVMEELGLIAEAGRIVLEKACRECATWPDHLKIAVNLSAHQFKRGDVVQTVRDALTASGLRPNRLELEITESALLERGPATSRCLDELRSLGVRISLDDFGTGYSSLSYLHQFPIDKLKIDRSFLSGIEFNARSLTLLRNVAQLSHNLGLRVVVEGVETEAQMALIVAEGTIDEVQGFLFSKAVPAPEMAVLIGASEHLRKAG